MAAPVVSVTVEDLDELLADGTYDRCWGRFVLWLLFMQVTFPICRRRAVAVITVTCSRDGSYTRGVCERHLRALRAHPTWVSCSECGERATWRVGGG